MIAGDILLGCYETSELLETNGIKHTVTEDGNVTILSSTMNEPKTSLTEDAVAVEEVSKEEQQQQ